MCALGPCRTPADLLICAVEEVPLGCPNRVELSEPDCELSAYLSRRDVHVTPAAAEKLIPRSLGDEAGTLKGLLSAGRLALLKPRVLHPIMGVRVEGGRIARFEAEPPLDATAVTAEEIKTWIKFKVVDDRTSAPIAGVALTVTLPDGKERTQATRADGMVEIDDIDPGACDVRCELNLGRIRLANTGRFVVMGDAPVHVVPDPNLWLEACPPEGAFVAHIEEHKVATGETIKSLADANGLTWQQLAQFNWDTSVPDEINEHLHGEVGCTKKTPDGFNYVFTTEDEPGLVYIPKPWGQTGLPTEQTHTIRVKNAAPFRFVLQNEEELRIPEAEYLIRLADGSKRRGRLGKTGVVLLKDPPPGRTTIEFLDLDDVEAKGLAANVRQGFDDRDLGPLWNMLRHPGLIIQLAYDAYDRHYNDFHGQGLRHDIEQEITDPDAAFQVHVLLRYGNVSDIAPADGGGPANPDPSDGIDETPDADRQGL